MRDDPPAAAGSYRDGDTQPIDLAVRARDADQVVTGMVCGLGLLGGGAAVVLGLTPGGLGPVRAAALACALLLRARMFRGRAQQLWLMIPGFGALIWLAVTRGGASATGAALSAAGPGLLGPGGRGGPGAAGPGGGGGDRGRDRHLAFRPPAVTVLDPGRRHHRHRGHHQPGP